MTTLPSKRIFRVPVLTAVIIPVVLAGCAELNNPYDPYYTPPSQQSYDPYYYPPSSPPPYYGGYRDGYQRDRIRQEQRQLDRERDRLERERDALDQQRRDEERRRRDEEVREQQERERERERRAVERCPSGFSPSEDKCSPEERRRGCKDIRLPSGLGCVRR